MFWINPYSQRNQRARIWPVRDFNRANGRVITKSGVYPESKAACGHEWSALGSQIRYLKWGIDDLQNYLALRRLVLKYEGQPRIDDGTFTFGRRNDDGPTERELVTSPAFLQLVNPALQAARAIQASVEVTLAIFAAMSARNTAESTAVLDFNARAFLTQPIGDPKPEAKLLTREQIEEACPRRAEVQSITDQAVSVLRRGDYPSAQTYGTAVHTYVQRAINAKGDPNFVAEISSTKSGAARYGGLGTTRLDAFENPGTGTVCVHDVKTGDKTRLSVPRTAELARAANRLYPGTTRIIVTEVRSKK